MEAWPCVKKGLVHWQGKKEASAVIMPRKESALGKMDSAHLRVALFFLKAAGVPVTEIDILSF